MFISRSLSRTNPLSRPNLRFRNPILPVFYYSEEPGGGGSNPPAPKQSKAEIDAEVERRVKELVDRQGSEAALATLVKSEFAQRKRAEKAEQERDEFKGKLPDEKAAKLMEAYQALGAPEEIQKALDAGKASSERLAGIERDKTLADVAGTLKLKQGALFNALLGTAEFIVEGEGEAKKVFVKTGDKTLSWEDYSKGRPEVLDALPALQLKDDQQSQRPPAPDLGSQQRGVGSQHGGAAVINQTPEAIAASRSLTRGF